MREYLKFLFLYLMEVIKEALPSVERGQFLVGTLVPIIIVAFSIGPVLFFGFTVGFTAQQWAFWLLIGVSADVVILTPTKIGVRNLRYFKPKLIIEETAFESNRGALGRAWGLNIKNIGGNGLHDLHAKLEALEFETPDENMTLARWPIHQDLAWAGQSVDKSYDLAGRQGGRLFVIYYDRVWQDPNGFHDPNRHVTIAYNTTGQFQAQHKIDFDQTILLLINVVCKEHAPQFVVCRIEPQLMRSLILEGISEREAFSILYVGKDKPSLEDFQSRP